MAALWSLALLATIGAGLVCWRRAIVRLLGGRPLVEWQPRRPAPWGLLDLVAVFLTLFLATVLVSGLLSGLGWRLEGPGDVATPEGFKLQAAANSLVPVLGMLGGVALVVLRTGASAGDLGWSWKHLREDLKLGFTAYVMLAPPVFALQAALVQFWESKHPLMEMFKESPQDHALFGLLFLAAVVVAPVSEELLFRVLLQGWLERVFAGRCTVLEFLLGGQGSGMQGLVASNTPVDPSEGSDLIEPVQEVEQPLRGWSAWLPIAISSAVFALLHWQHGPDWVPLTVLAAGMGYVYQRTHRIVPSLVVHVALNGMSMLGLWVHVRSGL